MKMNVVNHGHHGDTPYHTIKRLVEKIKIQNGRHENSKWLPFDIIFEFSIKF